MCGITIRKKGRVAPQAGGRGVSGKQHGASPRSWCFNLCLSADGPSQPVSGALINPKSTLTSDFTHPGSQASRRAFLRRIHSWTRVQGEDSVRPEHVSCYSENIITRPKPAKLKRITLTPPLPGQDLVPLWLMGGILGSKGLRWRLTKADLGIPLPTHKP